MKEINKLSKNIADSERKAQHKRLHTLRGLLYLLSSGNQAKSSISVKQTQKIRQLFTPNWSTSRPAPYCSTVARVPFAFSGIKGNIIILS